MYELFALRTSAEEKVVLPDLSDIARRRRGLGLTQYELARRAGVSRSLIAKVEVNRQVPNYRKAKAIFDVLEHVAHRQAATRIDATVGRIHAVPVVYADLAEPIPRAWRRMVRHAFSQLPVKDAERIVGSITERGINRRFMDGDVDGVRGLRVVDCLEDPFPIVSVATPVTAVIPLLQHRHAVLTSERGAPVGIVTNADVGKVFAGA
jgi:predicted transcriptional regulator